MTIAERIDSILKERNLSRRQLALKAGIPPSTLQSALQRDGNMSFEMLEKVANGLGVSVHLILSDDQRKLSSLSVRDFIQYCTDKGYAFDETEETLLLVFNRRLSEEGRDEAIQRIIELSFVPKYSKKNHPKKQKDDDSSQDS